MLKQELSPAVETECRSFRWLAKFVALPPFVSTAVYHGLLMVLFVSFAFPCVFQAKPIMEALQLPISVNTTRKTNMQNLFEMPTDNFWSEPKQC